MVSVDDVSPVAQPSSVDVLALDQALDALSSLDGRQCRAPRYFLQGSGGILVVRRQSHRFR